MAYIGKQPLVGNYQVLDAITATTTDTYALTKNSVAVFPQTPANCIVSLNGVIQAPFDSYTISGSNIVFASALTGSDSIDFITVLGDVLNVGTVSDGTITTAKLASGVLPTNTPAFFAYSTADQTINGSTQTKATLDTELFDTNNAFASSTFTVPSGQAGKYFFSYGGLIGSFVSGEWFEFFLYKNGSILNPSRSRSFISTSQSGILTASVIIDLAVSDYIDFYVLHSSGSSKTLYGTAGLYFTHLSGYKLIGA